MSNTPNLGLPIYGSSNTPDWMDTNNGFEKLDNIVGGVASVHLDFANPLYSFDSTHLSYTAVKDCYLYGCLFGDSNAETKLSINGTLIAGQFISANDASKYGYMVPITLLKEGDTVTATNLSSNAYKNGLGIYEGEIISDTFVWNEAIVELDYGNPLHTFTSGNLTYTATKTCYLCGDLDQNNAIVSINNIAIARGWYGTGYVGAIFIPPLKINAGDVVKVDHTCERLRIFDGTIKGSAPGNGGGGDVLELLDFDNAVELSTTAYTTPKAGAILGELRANSTSAQYLYIDNVIVASGSGTGSDAIPLQYYGIQKGSVIKLAQAQYNGGSGIPIKFVPYKYESIAPEITVYNEAEVELDYANPLHTFTAGNLTYTATGDCYLFGELWSASGNNELSINGVTYYRGYYQSPEISDTPVVYPIKLKAGDVVTVNSYANLLHVLKGTKVGSVGNLTGAWIEDYSNVLYSLTQATASYTCTEDGVLIGVLQSHSGSSRATITINGSVVYSPAQTHPGLAIRCNVKKGDVVEFSDVGIAYGCVHIYGVI